MNDKKKIKDYVWDGLTGFFGQPKLRDGQTVENIQNAWMEALKGYDPKVLQKSTNQAKAEFEYWPKLSEFVKLCREYKALEVPHIPENQHHGHSGLSVTEETAYKQAQGWLGALEEEPRRKAIDIALELCGCKEGGSFDLMRGMGASAVAFTITNGKFKELCDRLDRGEWCFLETRKTA